MAAASWGGYMSDPITTCRLGGRNLAMVMPLLLALGCLSFDPTPPPHDTTFSAYRVGAPDVLDVTVLPDPVISREVTVRPDGMISMDLIGDVPADGRTVDEISADIERRISRYKRDASVTVSLEAAQSTEVIVFGEVRRPSAFPLQKETRVAEAIARMGGETLFGRTGRIRVVRSGGGETAVYLVDLNAIRRGDLSTNIQLVTGDIVYVPPTIFARIGYAMNALLLPFQPLLGLANSVLGSAIAR
jgi:polysaccharide export outer membrane protein